MSLARRRSACCGCGARVPPSPPDKRTGGSFLIGALVVAAGAAAIFWAWASWGQLAPEVRDEGELPFVLGRVHASLRVIAPVDVELVERWRDKVVPQRRQLVRLPEDAEIASLDVAFGTFVREGQRLASFRNDKLAVELRATESRIMRLEFDVRGELSSARELFRQGLIAQRDLIALEQRDEDAALQLQVATRESEISAGAARLSLSEWRKELAARREFAQRLAGKLASLEVRALFDGRVAWVQPAAALMSRCDAEIVIVDGLDAISVELRVLRTAEAERAFSIGAPVRVAPGNPLADASESSRRLLPAGSEKPAAGGGGLQGRVVALDVAAGASMALSDATAANTLTVRVDLDAIEWARLSAKRQALWSKDIDVDVWTLRTAKAFRVSASAVARRAGRLYAFVENAEASTWSRREIFGNEAAPGGYLIDGGLVSGDVVGRLR